MTLQKQEVINDQLVILLNRLSDYFFILARKANAALGTTDIEVQY